MSVERREALRRARLDAQRLVSARQSDHDVYRSELERVVVALFEDLPDTPAVQRVAGRVATALDAFVLIVDAVVDLAASETGVAREALLDAFDRLDDAGEELER